MPATLNNNAFLVLRRDGSVATGVFVLDPATNPAASAALQAMANAAEVFGLMEPHEAEAFRVEAAGWEPRDPADLTTGKDMPSVCQAIANPELGPYEAHVPNTKPKARK